MGREGSPRRLSRRNSFIFWLDFFPAEAAVPQHPGPRAHVTAVTAAQIEEGTAEALSTNLEMIGKK